MIRLLGTLLLLSAATTAASADVTSSRTSWLVDRAVSTEPTLDRAALPQGDIGGYTDLGGYDDGPGGRLAKHMFLSLLLPGLGEATMGYNRGYAMMALDMASWFGAKHYHDLGGDKRVVSREYLDAHWSESRLEAAFGSDNDYVGTFYYGETDYTGLSLWISREDDEREYYENAGKWDQFVFGWDDFTDPREWVGTGADTGDLKDDPRVSANRLTYRDLRQESNDAFHNRDTLIYVNMFSRVFSVLQVAYLGGLFSNDGGSASFDVGGHDVAIIAEPRGLTATRLGFSVSY